MKRTFIDIITNRTVYMWLTILWPLFLIVMTFIPVKANLNPENSSKSFRLDYLIHFSVFFIWSMFFVLWKFKRKMKELYAYLLFFVIAAIISYLLEYGQSYTSTRVYNPVDFLYNLCGVFSGGVFFSLLLSQLFRRRLFTRF